MRKEHTETIEEYKDGKLVKRTITQDITDEYVYTTPFKFNQDKLWNTEPIITLTNTTSDKTIGSPLL